GQGRGSGPCRTDQGNVDGSGSSDTQGQVPAARIEAQALHAPRGTQGQAPAARIEAGALREARHGVMKVCRARTAAPTAQGWGWTCETDTEISIPMLRARADSIRSMVRPTSTGAAWTAGPDITITSMPRAL